MAEARGLIVAVGEYMLDKALADLPEVLRRWPQARVAVNVSGVELARPDYALALPYAFRDEFLARETEFRANGGKFLFPLPKFEVV